MILKFFIPFMVLVALLFIESSPQARIPSTVFNIGISSSPSQLNPFFATDAYSQNIGRLVFQPLIDVDQAMSMKCQLCKRFTHWMEKGKHHLRFQLKEDQHFWDGQKITSADVEKSVFYYTTELSQIQSIFRMAFSAIKKVVVHDPYDIEFIYDKFDLENISNLALLKIVKIASPLEKLEKVELKDIVGSGPYQFVEVKDLSIHLRPAFAVTENRPEFIFKVVRDETTMSLKLIKGEIDLCVADLSPRKQSWLLKDQKTVDLQTWTSLGSNLNYIGINHRRGPLQKVEVRKALSLLIPRDDLFQYKMRKTVNLASTLLSPSFEGKALEVPWDPYNPQEARRLLDLAGFPMDSDGVRMSLNWRSSNNKGTVEIAEVIADSMRKEGIKINLISQEWGTYYRSFKNGEFDLVSASWIGLTGPEMLRAAFHTDNFSPKGPNRGHYSNKEFDQLIDLATGESRENERNQLYLKAQRLLKDQFPYLYLWHPHIIWIGQKNLSMDNPYPNGSFYPLLGLRTSWKPTK